MRASSPTNYLQRLPQPAKVSPRQGEGTPPYRTFVGLQRVIKSSVGNVFDRSGAIAALCHYRIYCRPLVSTISKGRHCIFRQRAHDVSPYDFYRVKVSGKLFKVHPVSRTMQASSPTNYLQRLSQPTRFSPRRGEGTPPYRTFVGLQRVIKSSVGNGFDRSEAIAVLCHNRIYCRPLAGTIPKGRHCIFR